MKILIVSTYDTAGGAARASYRLHQALLSKDVDSNILVQKKFSSDYTVVEVDSKIERKFANVRPFIDYLPIRFYKKRTDTLFSPSYFPFSSVVKKINKINPDIVHGIGNEHLFPYFALKSGYKYVLTFHGILKNVFTNPSVKLFSHQGMVFPDLCFCFSILPTKNPPSIMKTATMRIRRLTI